MRRRGKACHWSMRRERGSVVGHWTGRIEAIAPSLFQAGSWSLLFTRFSADRKGRRSWDFANMIGGGSYRFWPTFTAGNDVEPGVFCGSCRSSRRRIQAVSRWGFNWTLFCRAPTLSHLTMECKRLFMRIKRETWIKWIKALFINGLNE